MGEFNFACPACGAEMEADESLRGSRVDCPACGSGFIAPLIDIAPGLDIDGFRLVRRLGAGGMGEVWLAKQESLDRYIALKILSLKVANDPDFLARFTQEVKMLGMLSHPNIITAYRAGVDKGLNYLAMEYVDGAELSSRLRIDKILPERDALLIVRKIAAALDYAWTKFKILHRDIKPENIMLCVDGEPKLMDLGISKSLADNSSLTMTGVVMGTPYYMSPEQARADKTLDCRSDIYSLGATFFHMVAGSVPYDGETAISVIAKHLSLEPSPSPRLFNKSLSPQCAALIKLMMSKDRGKRQADWQAVVNDIDRVLDGKYPEAGEALATMPSIPRQDLPARELRDEVSVKIPVMTIVSWSVRLILLGVIAFLAYRLWNSGSSKDDLEQARPAAVSASSASAEPSAAGAAASSSSERSSSSASAASPAPAVERSGSESLAQASPSLFESSRAPAAPKAAEPEKPAQAESAPAAEQEPARDIQKSLALPERPAGPPSSQAEDVASPPRHFARSSDSSPRGASFTKADAEFVRFAFNRVQGNMRLQRQERLAGELFLAVAGDVLQGLPGSAMRLLRDASDKPDLSSFKDEIETLKAACKDLKRCDAEVLRSLKKQAGSTVKLSLGGREGRWRLIDADPEEGVLVAAEAPDGPEQTFRVSEISPDYRLQFADKPVSASVLRGISDLEKDRPDDAASEFAQSGPLAKYISTALTLRNLREKFGGAARPPGQFGPRRQLLPDASESQPAREEPKGIHRLFRCNVAEFNEATLDIVLRYDFRDREQLSDWACKSGSGEAEIAKGALSLSSRDVMVYELKGRFDSLSAVATFKYHGNGFIQGIAAGGQNIDFLGSSFGNSMDGYFKGSNFEFGGPQGQRVRKSLFKDDSQISSELVWKPSVANFKAGSSVWSTLMAGSPEGVSFQLGVWRSSLECESVVVKGRLNKAWHEAAVKALAVKR